MTTIRLPRMLSDVANTELRHDVGGVATVAEALQALFQNKPGLRNHILDETGEIRPHVSIFVDGHQAGLLEPVSEDGEIRILHAVSGGGTRGV